jgi:hypothetical protein
MMMEDARTMVRAEMAEANRKNMLQHEFASRRPELAPAAEYIQALGATFGYQSTGAPVPPDKALELGERITDGFLQAIGIDKSQVKPRLQPVPNRPAGYYDTEGGGGQERPGMSQEEQNKQINAILKMTSG